MRVLSVLLCIGLMGCATPSVIAPAGPKQRPATDDVDIKRVCETVKTYTDAEAKALTDAVIALDPASIIIVAMADYSRMRADARACAKAAN